MSRVHDRLRSVKKTKSSRAAKKVKSVSGSRVKLPRSFFDIPKNQRVILEPDLLSNSRIIHDEFDLDAVTPYKMLRTRVLQKMDKNDWRVLAVTSSHQNAGKTITAINLAMMIARSGGRRVYLLDIDLRKPGIAKSLGIDDISAGVGDYLSGERKIKDVVWGVGEEDLFVLPGKGRFDHSSELLVSETMTDLVSAIRSDSSEPIVIIDLPPVLAADDALAIAPLIDALLFVVAEGETKRADISHSLELLRDVELLGVVLNKSRDAHPGY